MFSAVDKYLNGGNLWCAMKLFDISILLLDRTGNCSFIYDKELPTEELFNRHVSSVKDSLEEVLNAGIEGIPDIEIRGAYMDLLRIGYERLKQLSYPEDVEKARKVIYSIYKLAPRL